MAVRGKAVLVRPTTHRSGLSGLADRALNMVERTGNRLPDPITLFVLFMGIVLVLSWVASMLGLSAVHPQSQEEIRAINLLTPRTSSGSSSRCPGPSPTSPPWGWSWW
jgi:aminobenzoyl-glutamate transport protein